MKNILRAFSILLIVLMVFSSIGFFAYAEEAFSREYYRAHSMTGGLTETERDDLDQECLDFARKYQIDFAVTSANESDIGELELKDYAEKYFINSEYGYGKDRDGIMAIYVADSNKLRYFIFGKVAKDIPEDYIKEAQKDAAEKYEKYQEWGVLYSSISSIKSYFTENPDYLKSRGIAVGSDDKDRDKGSSNGNMPSWYPDDVSDFEFFHDEKAPRLVDTADILTDEQEKLISRRLAAAKEKANKDFVVFTDTSTYGLSRSVYAADFYDFNGYGIGDDREGVCLMICMDPDDRGWWAACTGPETMEAYTEEVANEIDDVLYAYMSAGEYAKGIYEWIGNMENLLARGYPFMPEWYPEDIEGFVRTHDSDVPRVSSNGVMISDADIESLSNRCKELSDRFGYDVVLHFTRSDCDMGRDVYTQNLYHYGGYGFGEDYDGIVACYFEDGKDFVIEGYGSVNEKLNAANKRRMRWHGMSVPAVEAAESFIVSLEQMERTGRVGRGGVLWVLTVISGLALGFVIAIIDRRKSKKGMQTPEIAENADVYVLGSSAVIKKTDDSFVNLTKKRRYSPKASNSSSGGSSGGSSYSSSYSGSSGSSHSGSGRSF